MSVLDDPGLFGRMLAAEYDAPNLPDPEPAVEFLAGLAGDGPALELAIGTGRVALPLGRRGTAVEGIEASPEMLRLLRAKPGGAEIPVVVGDMADADPPGGPYPLVFLVFNTLFLLTSERRQEDCFRNVARMLGPGGAFVIEAFVPDPDRFERPKLTSVTEDSVTFMVHQYDRAAQTVIRQLVVLGNGGVQLKPLALHYRWPEQIDELAARAGLSLRARYANWQRDPFGPDSQSHVSVYRAA